MRILVALTPFEVFSSHTGGAVATVAEGLGRGWAELGHDIHVTTPDDNHLHQTAQTHVIAFPPTVRRRHPRRILAAAEGRARRFDWPAYRIYVNEVRRVARAVAPDRLIVHNDLVLPALVSRRLCARTLIHLHNDFAAKDAKRARRVLTAVRGTVAVSNYIAQKTEERFAGVAVRTINNGIDVSAFGGERLVLAAGAPLRVAFLGRLLPDKGPHVLVAAAEQLQQQGRDLVLTVIGSPNFLRPSAPRADPYVREVAERVEAIGGSYEPHLDRGAVAEHLSRQDVLVVPSLFPDPFPLVVMEAMAAGCVVVASHTGGLPEAVGDAGLLFPPGDAGAVAGHLRALADDVGLRARLVAAGRRRAAAHDWRLVSQQWTPLLDDTS